MHEYFSAKRLTALRFSLGFTGPKILRTLKNIYLYLIDGIHMDLDPPGSNVEQVNIQEKYSKVKEILGV